MSRTDKQISELIEDVRKCWTPDKPETQGSLAPARGCLALRRRMMRLAESWECRAGAMEARGYRTLLEASLAESFRERAGELRLELEKPDNSDSTTQKR